MVRWRIRKLNLIQSGTNNGVKGRVKKEKDWAGNDKYLLGKSPQSDDLRHNKKTSESGGMECGE